MRTVTLPTEDYVTGRTSAVEVSLHTDPSHERCGAGILPDDVMRDVATILQPGVSVHNIARHLIPLAFRLLCMAAFR